jgi:hypothetical protein
LLESYSRAASERVLAEPLVPPFTSLLAEVPAPRLDARAVSAALVPVPVDVPCDHAGEVPSAAAASAAASVPIQKMRVSRFHLWNTDGANDIAHTCSATGPPRAGSGWELRGSAQAVHAEPQARQRLGSFG